MNINVFLKIRVKAWETALLRKNTDGVAPHRTDYILFSNDSWEAMELGLFRQGRGANKWVLVSVYVNSIKEAKTVPLSVVIAAWYFKTGLPVGKRFKYTEDIKLIDVVIREKTKRVWHPPKRDGGKDGFWEKVIIEPGRTEKQLIDVGVKSVIGTANEPTKAEGVDFMPDIVTYSKDIDNPVELTRVRPLDFDPSTIPMMLDQAPRIF